MPRSLASLRTGGLASGRSPEPAAGGGTAGAGDGAGAAGDGAGAAGAAWPFSAAGSAGAAPVRDLRGLRVVDDGATP
jgi:hypothetical protein